MSSTFTVKQISEILGVGIPVVLGWISRTELRAMNVARRMNAKRPTWRVTQESFEAFCQLRTPNPPAPRMRKRRQSEGVIEFYK